MNPSGVIHTVVICVQHHSCVRPSLSPSVQHLAPGRDSFVGGREPVVVLAGRFALRPLEGLVFPLVPLLQMYLLSVVDCSQCPVNYVHAHNIHVHVQYTYVTCTCTYITVCCT